MGFFGEENLEHGGTCGWEVPVVKDLLSQQLAGFFLAHSLASQAFGDRDLALGR